MHPNPTLMHIHTCGDKKLCCVSKLSLKNMEERPGDQLLHKDSWMWPEKGNPAAGPVSGSSCKEEQGEHCQSPALWLHEGGMRAQRPLANSSQQYPNCC